jgi:hypothetical protein
MEDITAEDMKQACTSQLAKNHYYMTFADLKSLVKRLEAEETPDDTPVVYQRINDFYFDKLHWGTMKVKGESYYRDLRYAEKHGISVDQVANSTEEVIPVFCGHLVEDFNTGEEYIFLTAHY